MYYELNDDVYLVEGKAKSCIYDLNNSKLFSVNKALSDKIIEINENRIPVETDIDCELKNTLEKLIENGIIKISRTHSSKNINDIIKKDTGCKFAWIEITNKCNLKCIHCYNESDSHCDSVMKVHDFYRIIDSLSKIGVPKIQITGGEPFLNRDNLKMMLNYSVGKFSYIEIFTNGTLITDEWFKYLAENNIHIALSVYSYVPQMHDSVTGLEGSFEKTNQTISNLKKYNIPYRVCNVLMKGIELGKKDNDLYTLSEDKDVVRVTGRANLNLMTDNLMKKRLITKKTFQRPITKSFCARLISGHNCFNDKIYISADLEVFPCVMERRIKHCSLKEHELILDKEIRKLTKDKIKECCECEYRYACFDCRPNSLDKDMTEKPWYCTYNPIVGEWMNEDEFIKKIKEKWGII